MNKTVIGIIVAIVLAVLGITAFTQLRGDKPTVEGQDTSDNSNDALQGQTITALHQFNNGRHTVAGEVELPTPCHTLTATADIAESSPEQVTINLQSGVDNEAICAQVMTPKKFKVEFGASEAASIRAVWNGQTTTLNLVPIGPTDNIDSFDLFIKA